MKRALLINMPWGRVWRPSLGLSLLKAALVRDGLPCDIQYLNLLFARRLGEDRYRRFVDTFPEVLLGEWIFAGDLFGEQIPPPERYLAEILHRSRAEPFRFERLDRDDAAQQARVNAEILAVRAAVAPYLDDCLDAVPWGEYGLVGFTSTFEQNTASLALARRLKERYPELVIVFGGANCDGEMGVGLHRLFPFVDYVCSGEGDIAFPLLARRVLQQRPVGEIAGIVRRVDGQTTVPRMTSAPVMNMDSLPMPDYDDFIEQHTAASLTEPAGRPLMIETSRGCWWGQKSHCTFCGLNGSTIQFRAKSPERALAEIAYLVERYGTHKLDAVDNIIDLRYLREMLPRLIELDLQVDLFYETKANLRKEQVRLLREAGVVHIQPGIESLNTSVLRRMRKGVTAIQNVQLLRWCAEYMVAVAWNVLGGFPGEDPADYARQAEIVPLLTHLAPPSGLTVLRLNRFSPHFTEAAAFGLRQVRPVEAYHYVYPFATDDLATLAYHFDFDYADERDPTWYLEPLHRALLDWVDDDGRSTLTSHLDRGARVVRDTRPVAVAREHRLVGLARAVYEFCDEAHTGSEIEQHAATLPAGAGGSAVAAVLDELVAARLLLCEDQRYLSLAVPTAYRLEQFLAGSPAVGVSV